MRNRLALVGVILGVMRSSRTALAALPLLALVVSGCSGGGGTHSSPTTAHQAIVHLGPCPKTDPNTDQTKSNAAVKGLDRAMVPIAALRVRMCRYSSGDRSLVGERTMTRPSNVARFEAEANRFPASPPTTAPPGPQQGLIGMDCPQGWYHVVTFASASQRVELRESCGWVGNSVLGGSDSHWFAELQRYTEGSTATGTVVGTVLAVGGLRMRRQIPGKVFASDASGAERRATTTATRPFSLTLRVGTYRFTGSSPLINSGRTTCRAAAPVVVVSGKTNRVEVICSID